MEWNKKDEWKAKGENFIIVVSRHEASPIDESEGVNRWCIYAYVYPDHWHYSSFDGDSFWQDAASIMPFHGGATYLKYHVNEGKITSIQVGCDYNHLGDSRYTHMESKEDAGLVFHDAEELFNWLDKPKLELVKEE